MDTKIRFSLIVVILFTLQLMVCESSVIKSGTTNNDESKTDQVIRCRQKCLSKILVNSKFDGQLMQYFRCKNTPNCYMCWDYCRAVSLARKDLAAAMCSDKPFCMKGCKIACRFNEIITSEDVIVKQ